MPVFAALQAHPILQQLQLPQLLQFLRLAACLKNDILLCQPSYVSTECAPDVLPPSIAAFLSEATGIPLEHMDACWDVLKDDAWQFPSAEQVTAEDEDAFINYGWARGLCSSVLYPPNRQCTNPDCAANIPLKKAEPRQIVVYTLAKGVRPSWEIHLSCPTCHTNYQHNFSVRNGIRSYYGGVPNYLKVGDHQYVERKLAAMWISMMLLAWVSATNCARTYDMALSEKQSSNIEAGGWQFGTLLTTDHVWDSFVILTLLDLHQRNNTRLEVPHTGDQKDRFTAAMEERNLYVIQYGQDEAGHFCDKCMRTWEGPDGTKQKCQIIVSDGINMGFPCCGTFRCTEHLTNNRHRFCTTHFDLHGVCAVNGCDNLVAPGAKTCTLPAHAKMEKLHIERGKAAFILKERLQKHRMTHPNSTVPPDETTPDGEMQDEDDVETFEVDAAGGVRMRTQKHPGSIGVDDTRDECEAKKDEAGNQKQTAQLGRRRTHNEQTLIRPCAVFHARATMYGAEAVSNVLLFVEAAFSVPAAHKPEHLVYDTNCDAKQQVHAHPEEWAWFSDMGMCVDVWHFLNKHATTHVFCQEHCNPADYPELMGPDGQWFFNTSVAEQANVWLGGYHSMCREMLPVKYNFFLDEMIRLRNQMVVAKLAQDGHNPGRAPPRTA
ncbi:hypothetical protein C8R47DRAFT_1327226 [Mycena vitilis]|nr:hypothetical protein C8R47DRAFT_1327226 [Mycena vitilis]